MSVRTRAWLIIAGSGIFILLILVLNRILVKSTDPCDPTINSKTVIVIDRTEEVATQTADLIIARISEFVSEKVKNGERVSVFSITESSKGNLTPEFSMCKPQKDGNRLIENTKKVAERFKKEFEEPLRKVISAPIGTESQTPLAQGLIDLSLDDKHFRSSEMTNLLIFSDFLENTQCFSMYRNCADGQKAIEQFRACRMGAVERPKFKNTCVRMNIMPRTNNPNVNRQTLACRAIFWNWFFGDIEGSGCVGENNKVNLLVDYLGGS